MTGAPSLSLPPIPSHSSQRNVSSYRSLPRYIGTPSAPPCSCPQRCTPHRFTSWHVGIASSPRQVTQLLSTSSRISSQRFLTLEFLSRTLGCYLLLLHQRPPIHLSQFLVSDWLFFIISKTSEQYLFSPDGRLPL
ncbi:hypothetical protein SprV_0200966600 [Sparganum proliferum]